MPEGGELTIRSRRVRVARGGTEPAHVAVEFRDTGQGMSEEQRRRAFASVLSTTKAKGTGLGLAIVARIVEAHRGRIKIRSRPGHGTTVTVFLPR
jgi:signal transduction histidine kinase